MSTMTQAVYPVAPTVEKRKSSLLDVANVTGEFKWLDGLALFQTFNCMTFLGSAEFCAPASKDIDDTATWMDGFRFSAYGGFTCKPFGRSPEADTKILAAFEAGESTAVEAAFVAQRFVENESNSDFPGEWPEPEVITAVASPVLMIAAMEEYAATHYNGYGTLHLPIGLASRLLADNMLVWDGNILRTRYGSKVAAGAGYSLADPEKAYVTGEVWIGQSDTISQTAMDTTNNDVINLVERGYVAAVDCFAATVSLT